MPIKMPANLPAYDVLTREGVMVMDPDQAARQEHVCGTGIGITMVPFDQRDLVQCGRGFRAVGKEDACAGATLYPQVLQKVISLERVIAGIKPTGDVQRVLSGLIRHRINRAFGIHVEQHRAEGPGVAAVEPVGQRPDGPRVAERVDEEFVGIDSQAPVTVAISAQQPVHPVHAEAGSLVAFARVPDRHIGLRSEQFRRAIRAVIVDKNEMGHAHFPVVFQEIGQPDAFVAQRAEHQNVLAADQIGAVGDRFQFAAFAERAESPAFSLKP